jgi:hypothetical protein
MERYGNSCEQGLRQQFDKAFDFIKFNFTLVSILADTYFSKEPFVGAVCDAGFNTVSRLGEDAGLTYLIESVKIGKRGRPKTMGRG